MKPRTSSCDQGSSPTQRALLALILGVATAVRIWLIPALTRHAWEGHEAEYLAVFQGSWQGDWSTRVVPLLGWLYRGLGQLSQEPQLLVVLSVLLSLLSLWALAHWVAHQVGMGAALLATLLVALYGNHAFWSSSAYNVMAPHTLLLLGAALATRRGWAATTTSGILVGAAVGTRPELAAYVLPVAFLLHARPWTRRAAWGASSAVVLIACLLPLGQAGAHPEGLLAQLPSALRTNLTLPVFLAPFSTTPALMLTAALAAVAAWRRTGPAISWLMVLLLGHVSSACFADSGFRQALLPGVAICVLSTLGITSLWELSSQRTGAPRWLPRASAGVALLAILALLGRDTLDIADRYYAEADPLIHELAAANPQPVDEATISNCTELITTPARTEGERSPFDPLDSQACWLWQEDFQHRRWTSLGVHDRARRMHHHFVLEPLGMRRDPQDPNQPPRQLWRVVGAR